MFEKQKSVLSLLSKSISTPNFPKSTLYLEKLPPNSSLLRRQIYDFLSRDYRIEAFSLLETADSNHSRQDYIDAAIYASRFLLGNQLINECYILLKVCQDHVESIYGEPIDYTLVEEIGNMFYLSGQCFEAIKWYEKLMDLNEAPESRMYFNIGMCYQVMQNYAQAIDAYLKSTLADSRYSRSWINLGNCYLEIGKGDKALQAFQQLPLSAESLMCQGNAHFKMNNYEEAIAFYLRGIELREEAGTYNNLGCALKKIGLLQDAVYAFTDSLSIQPNNEASYNLLILYIECGKIGEALQLFQTCMKVLTAAEAKMIGNMIDEFKVERKSNVMGETRKKINGKSKIKENFKDIPFWNLRN